MKNLNFIFVFLLFFLNSCGKSEEIAQTGVNITPVVWYEDLEETRDLHQNNLNGIFLNSNVLNLGYLVYDIESDNTYVADVQNGGIWKINSNNVKNKIIEEVDVERLQIYEDKLFWIDEDSRYLVCYDLNSNECKDITDYSVGEYLIIDEYIYLSCTNGLVRVNIEGNEQTIIYEGSYQIANWQITDDEIIIGNVIQETDVDVFMEGYVVAYDIESEKFYKVCSNAWYPLCFYNFISVWDVTSLTRNVLNDNGDEIYDTGRYIHRVVTDGQKLYYADCEENCYSLYLNENGVEDHLFMFDEYQEVKYLYITDNSVYVLLFDRNSEGYTWYSYDLKEEKIEKII